MRILTTTLVLLIVGACTGSTPANVDSGRACDARLYDRCLDEHNCTSMLCRGFPAAGTTPAFEVCSMPCTVGNDAPCGMTADGRAATCDMGFCKPPGPNDCVLR
jgi:hypothetical protein